MTGGPFGRFLAPATCQRPGVRLFKSRRLRDGGYFTSPLAASFGASPTPCERLLICARPWPPRRLTELASYWRAGRRHVRFFEPACPQQAASASPGRSTV